ncbi:MAG: hypothetical protein AB7T06_00470 [Kofleriaceae bacterium]
MDFDFPSRRYSRSRSSSWRRRHRHMFSWLVLGGGVILVGLLLIALLNALGVFGLVSGAYFAAALAVLPSSWHEPFQALPGIVHVLIVLGVLGIGAAIAGELVD